MENIVSDEVKALFAQYEQYNRTGDYKRLAKLYSRPAIAAGPNGVAVHRNNLITRWQFDKAMRAFYEKAGLSSIHMRVLTESLISDCYSLVQVSWVATFRKTKDQPIEFHISYIVRKAKHRVEIVLFIAHEDERKILEGYGILQ